MTALRTAVIGFGTAGRVFHAPLIQADPSYDLVAIVTASPDRVAAATAEYPVARIVPSADELFAAADELGLDLVVIGTPNQTHATLALTAIGLGLNVVLDKPIAVTSVEAAAVGEAASTAGVTLTVFQNRRWDGDFLTLRDALESGAVGDVHQFESAFEWWSPTLKDRWKDTATPAQGGGILYDLAPHLVDQALQLFGPVAEVHAELDSRRPGAPADDDAFVTLLHENGVRSRLWMSAISPSPRPRFRVVGSERVLTFTGLDPQEPQLIAGIRPGDEGYGVDADGRSASIVDPDGTAELPIHAGDYPEFYRLLATALRDGGPVPVDPAESIAALQLIESASVSR